MTVQHQPEAQEAMRTYRLLLDVLFTHGGSTLTVGKPQKELYGDSLLFCG